MSPAIEENMPQYQVKDAKHWLAVLREADIAWTKVMKQEGTIKSFNLDANEAQNNISSAKVSQQTFSSSMTLALANIQRHEHNSGDAHDAKRTRKKGKRK